MTQSDDNPYMICDVCGYDPPYGRVDLDRLRYPIKGGMFLPKGDGYPKPFPYDDTEWQYVKCPICKRRPFSSERHVQIKAGVVGEKRWLYVREDGRPLLCSPNEQDIPELPEECRPFTTPAATHPSEVSGPPPAVETPGDATSFDDILIEHIGIPRRSKPPKNRRYK